jgi:archaellum component FlaC
MDQETKQFIQAENEKLATMVAKGFAEVYERMDKRFDEVNDRFADVDKRFDEVDKRFERVEVRLARIEQSVEYHGADIARLTDDMRLVKTAARI